MTWTARLAALLTTALAAAVAPTARGASLSHAEMGELLAQANAVFRQANDLAMKDREASQELYRKAALRLERIVEEGGVRNGLLYYNIGNAYFRMGDLGRAILNYRRARLYTPNDPNLLENLQYARSRTVDRIEEKEETRALQTVLFWHYDLSTRARAMLFAVFFVLFWVGAAVRLLVARAAPRWLLGVLGAVALALFLSLAAEEHSASRNVAGVILEPEVIARKGDGEAYEPSFKAALHAGTEFILIEERAEWRSVELADGRSCWLPAKSVGLVR